MYRKHRQNGEVDDDEEDEVRQLSKTVPTSSLSGEKREFPATSYTIAWICALHIEMAAAQAMLDEQHGNLPNPHNDSNSYTLGRIEQHHVVIACLPLTEYGTTNAANVLANLKRTFESIRVGLMVGIGGGVPNSNNDIRLGDVVVGIRVMPYELGKITAEGQIQQTGVHKLPHQSLGTLLSSIRAKHELEASRVPAILHERFHEHPNFHHPSLPDHLYRASYDHDSSIPASCDGCDESSIVPRRLRESSNPEIHYGGIASGDKLMRHGLARDQLARKLDVICFEMESAGLMDILPCLPIRGICDYSDTHKNKNWQRYAAATAAAYARQLLEVLPVAKQDNVSPLIRREPGTLDPCAPSNGNADNDIAKDRREALLKSLQFDQMDTRKTTIKQANRKTCQWLLQTPEHQRWQNSEQTSDHHGFLWIRGKPGVGKSTIMKFMATGAKKADRPSFLTVSFFFNARGEMLEKSISGMFRSLLLQVMEKFTDLQSLLSNPEIVPRSQTDCPSLEILKELFRTVVEQLGRRSLTCYIDALDEGDEQQIMEMVQFFEDLAAQSAEDGIKFKTCFSSRHYPYIDIRYGERLTLESQEGHMEDLINYIQETLRVKDRTILAELQSQLVEKSGGVFLWVQLVVDILNLENRRGRLALQKRLADIPPGLSNLFKDMLARDQNNMNDLLLSITWILFSKRPLRPSSIIMQSGPALLQTTTSQMMTCQTQ